MLNGQDQRLSEQLQQLPTWALVRLYSGMEHDHPGGRSAMMVILRLLWSRYGRATTWPIGEHGRLFCSEATGPDDPDHRPIELDLRDVIGGGGPRDFGCSCGRRQGGARMIWPFAEQLRLLCEHDRIVHDRDAMVLFEIINSAMRKG